jgi:pimeloyl-ACP methyl ester carboxylesterase
MRRTTFLVSAAATGALAGIPGLVRASADLTLTTPTGKLAGTLELPAASGLVPIALIIAGSGPTDRDGNTPALPGKNDALKQLALGLAARGVASLRYDKRGIGASAAGASEADLRFDMYVDDAVAWIGELRAQKRFSRVVIAGHSEGSLIGMLAAARAKADGFVSIDGAGRPAAQILREQMSKAPPPMAAQAFAIIDQLAAGHTVTEAPPELAGLLRPSVQPYLISWLKYDPAHEIANVKSPAAIVQGTADIQVTLVDAEKLHAALPSARYVVVEGMNHVLKHAPDHSTNEALIAGYTNPALQVESAVIDTVARIAGATT